MKFKSWEIIDLDVNIEQSSSIILYIKDLSKCINKVKLVRKVIYKMSDVKGFCFYLLRKI